MRHITKNFGGVHALRDVTFTAHAGEVHALCGENGAGKSTLMKILAGAITDYEGQIVLDGRPVAFSGPRDAEDAGIRIIYQELNLVTEMTVAANIFLGREKTRGPRAGSTTARWRPRRGGCSTAWGRRSSPAPGSATCGSATSRWSRSPRRWSFDAADPDHGRADLGALRRRGRPPLPRHRRPPQARARPSSTSRTR